MPRQTFAYNLRSAGVFNRGWTETVVTQNSLAIRAGNGHKGLGGAFVMTLASMALQKFIQCRIAAIEAGAIMLLGNRLFMPVGKAHERRGKARAAFRSFALGAGGFSSACRTSRLS